MTCGLLLANTPITWEKMEGSNMNLTGKSKGKVERQQIMMMIIIIIIIIITIIIRWRVSRSSTRTGTSARWASGGWTPSLMPSSGKV